MFFAFFAPAPSKAEFVYSHCSSRSATLCAVQTARRIASDVALLLNDSTVVTNVLADVTNGAHNQDDYFWPSVLDDHGVFLACGRPGGAGSGMAAGAESVGRSLDSLAAEEADIDQSGLFARIVQHVSEGTYHFDWFTTDGLQANAEEALGVQRVGFVYPVLNATMQPYMYVISSFTDRPSNLLGAEEPCDDTVDNFCAVTRARTVRRAPSLSLSLMIMHTFVQCMCMCMS